MSSKIKAVDIVPDEVKEEATVEVGEDKPIEEPVIEKPIEEECKDSETPKGRRSPSHQRCGQTDEVEIKEIIREEADKPKASRKMVTCPDCGKTMYEKNFRYQHLSVCGKVKQPKLRAKPIEEVIKEKREKVESKEKPVAVEELPPPPPPPIKPTYLELRREYNNQLKERKQQLVKRLVSKAF
jgi:hypothetical protein